ncbi:glycosyltransferase family 2 protein [Aliiruegeria sabulilitoris]|uniref:glycosyltransferase family 2 protein n=1 Tax=Aliiruegeria sabulilitoris TaxID=1510458 RepID=UPI0008353A24|nr:glycosyltransferase family 2 protein [Aliiruegeria sabulilitoris]NDR56627.1 glycosyltransferase [Pseudoruegeria sp. M32A2M]
MKITVITAVYNRVETIAQALDSVAAQSYGDVEHLVVDGASTDGTLEVVQERIHHKIRVISEPDDGIYDALNKGIAAATGDIVGLMHSDDFFAQNDVLSNVAYIFETTGADAVYGDLDYISASNPAKVIRHWKAGVYTPRKLARGWMPPHPTLFMQRDVLERLGTYDTSYRISADYEAILRWFGKGGVASFYLPEVLVKMRVGGESNRSIERILRKSCEDYRALRSNRVGGVGALAWKNFSKLTQFLNK